MRILRHRPSLVVALAIAWLVGLAVLAIGANLLPLASFKVPVGVPQMPPGLRLHEPLGTDSFGRSELSRVVYGARVSLGVGLLSTLAGMLVGGAIGTAAGYFRGRLDAVVTVLLDAALSFPALVLLLALAAVLTPSIPTLVVSFAIITIPYFARLARANAIRLTAREFVTAARLMGAGHGRILLREVTPNLLVPIASYAVLIVATVIVVEGALSFLGLGIPPPQPSWGGMINEGRQQLATDPHLVFVPALTLLLTVLSLNVVGDSARRRFDPRGESTA